MSIWLNSSNDAVNNALIVLVTRNKQEIYVDLKILKEGCKEHFYSLHV